MRSRNDQPAARERTAEGDLRVGDDLQVRIVSLARRLSTGTFDLLMLIGKADESGIWARRGALSCAAWIASICGVEISTARSQVRVARALITHGALHAAMESGSISYAKARMLVPHLTVENASELIEIAVRTSVGRLGAAIASWSARNEDPDLIADRHHEERAVTWRTDPDGMVTITARLEPYLASQICALIDKAVRDGRDTAVSAESGSGDAGVSASPGNAPTGAARGSRSKRCSLRQQRADALGRLLLVDGGGHVDTEVVVHVNEDGNHLADGTPLLDHTVASLLPDAFVSLLLFDCQRIPIDASPRRRFPTRRQKRVVDARFKECVQPGCSASMFLQYDHREPYDGQNTVIDNLQPLCGPHNRAKKRTGSSA